MTRGCRLSCALAAGLLLAAAAGPAEVHKVVVNSANPVASLARREVSALFLRRSTAWSDGTPAVPVDGPVSAARESFSKAVHGKKTEAVKSYWLEAIFSGRGVPPVEKASDKEVLDFVKAHPGAIGYVADGTPTDDVKVLTVKP